MEEESVFNPKNLDAFLKKVLYAEKVMYPVSQQSNSPSQPPLDVYFVALQKMGGKELAESEWRSELNTNHSVEESKGMYPYLQGKTNYKSLMKFNDGDTVELEIEYYSGFMSQEMERIINVLSLYRELDLPDADLFDIRNVKGKLRGVNRFEALEPLPQMKTEYEVEFSINLAGSDIIVKNIIGSRDEFLVEYKGVKKRISDKVMLNYENDLISTYFSSQSIQCCKPKIRVNGKDVSTSQYLDRLLSSSLTEDVYNEIRDLTLNFISVAKKLPVIEDDVAELKAELHNVQRGLPEDESSWQSGVKEKMDSISNELSSRSQTLNTYVSQVRSYGNFLIGLEGMCDSLRSVRFNETYLKYKGEIDKLLTGEFMKEVRNILAKYKQNNPLSFLNLQFADEMYGE